METVAVDAIIVFRPIDVQFMDLIPAYAHPGDAGMDLKAAHDAHLPAGRTVIVGTGFQVAIPVGFEMQIRSRSGLAAKNGLFVLNSPGTIDSGYRGEIKVILHNSNTESYTVHRGDRIAQAVIHKLPVVTIEVCPTSQELPSSDRGAGGLGSTGIR